MKNFPDWFFNQVDWQEKTLKDLGYFYGGLSGKNKNDFGHGNADFITYMNVYKNNFADINQLEKVEIKENEKQNLVQYGDILFTQSSETVEEIAISSVWLHDKKTYLNSFCLGFRPNDLKILYPQFAGFLFRSESVKKKFILEGQGISRFNISQSRIENISVKIPPLAEQKQIADYFTHLDNAINAQETKLKSWREVKKAMLQKIFNQQYFFTQDNGDKFPAWQEKTLGEVCEINPSNSELPKNFYYIDLESVVKGNLTKNILLEKNSAPSRAQRILKADDVIFQMVRPYQQNNYFFESEKDFPTVASTGYAQLRAKEKFLPKFLYFCLYENNFVNQVLFRCVGGTYPAINAEDLSQCKIKIPCEEEQKKIAEYFSSLDRIIDAENKMLENLHLMKRGLLQKLFV